MMSRIEEALKRAKELSDAQLPIMQQTGHTALLTPSLPLAPSIKSVAQEIVINSPRLVAVNDCNQPITEEYKKLKSIVVRKIRSGELSRRILVTSALSGDGKSVTALNLAISLAQDYDSHVVLIDTDLRNPSICRYLGLERKAGLTDCLADGADVEDVLLETGLGNLLLLAAGRKVDNPVELLSTQKMEALLKRLEELFPGVFIVMDSCPILPFAEPRVLASLAGNTIFVVKEAGTSQKNFLEAMNLLGNTNVLGVIYNKATYLGLAGGYQYYYYNYVNQIQGQGGSLTKPGLLTRILRRMTGKKPGDDLNV